MNRQVFSVPRLLPGVLLFLLLTSLSPSTVLADGPVVRQPYIIRFGDTFASIAARFGISVPNLLQANGMSSPFGMYVGQQIYVPRNAPSAYGAMFGFPYGSSTFGPSYRPPVSGYGTAPSSFVYLVRPGDTLFNIAARFRVSVSVIININHLFNPFVVFPGMRLLVPMVYPAYPTYPTYPSYPTYPTYPMSSSQIYIVQPGDTLSAIALRYRVSVFAIVIANNIPNPNLIFPGMRLVIPSGPGYGAPSGPSPYSPSPYGTAPQPYPTPGQPGVTPTPQTGGSAPAFVSMKNIAYNPNAITVRVGTTVTWTNQESSPIPHTVTSGTPGAPSGMFDSGTLNQNQSYQFTFTTPGTFPYYCRIHGAAMTGTVTVTQ